MPINIPETLPAAEDLRRENIFFLTESKAIHQDIRPLEIALLNLMPKKIETETQLLRLIGNSPLQVHITLLTTASYAPKNTPEEHLFEFYTTFDTVKEHCFDGLIITGAPVEKIPFEAVVYWQELSEIMEWSKRHVYSTLHICWGAQAGLFHHYGIEKHLLSEKLSGVYPHTVQTRRNPLVRGFDDRFYAPHSRYTGTDIDAVAGAGLEVLAVSEEAGLFLASSPDLRQVFVTGHSEYDAMTLDSEYRRDLAAGISPAVPTGYYSNNDPEDDIMVTWRGHAHLLFSNWLNYAVYQETPFDPETIQGIKDRTL